MKTIKVSDATYRAIAAATQGRFQSTATRQPDGTWLVPLEDGVYDRLLTLRLPGEEDDDTVMRLLHKHAGRPLN